MKRKIIVFFTETRTILHARYGHSAHGLCSKESSFLLNPGQGGSTAKSNFFSCSRKVQGHWLPPRARVLRVRGNVPTWSSGLVTAQTYSCGSWQKAGAFLYLHKNGRKLQSRITGSELQTVIPPPPPSASFWLQFACHVGADLAPKDGCVPSETCNWRRQ